MTNSTRLVTMFRHSLWIAALACASGALQAQTSLELAVQEGGGFSVVPSTASINFQAPSITEPVTLRLRIRSLGIANVRVDDISIANARFALAGVGTLPRELTRGQSIEFDVTYTPLTSVRVSTLLGVTVTSGQIVSGFQFSLAGTAPEFRIGYTVGSDGNTLPLADGSEIAFPSTPAGSASTASLVIANVGSAAGLVNSIRVDSSPFSPLGLPLFPSIVGAGQEFRFGVRFAPTSAGPFNGTLAISLVTGEITASLSGVGAGPRFTFELSESAGLRPIQSGEELRLANTAVGSTSSLAIRVTNSGDASSVVPSISLTGNTSFRLTDLPVATSVIGPGGSFTFQVVFTPRSAGQVSGILSIGGSTQFAINGSGVGLPSFEFTGAPATVQELQQHTIGLRLSGPYPLPLRGAITLGFESDAFSIDPALVFSTGTRSVTFQIPAGETEAIFSNGARQIRFQTGSIAGTILLTPQFVSGDVDVTPPGSSTLRITLPPSRPRLVNLQIGALTQNSVTFLVNGSATTRSLATIEFVFNQVAGSTAIFNDRRVVVGVEALADGYFRSAESSAFGGQFRVTVPFNLSATTGTAPDLLTLIESATVTITNREGASNTLTVSLR